MNALKKKYVLFAVAALVLIAIIAVCIWCFSPKNNEARETAEPGEYIFEASDEISKPRFVLNEDGTFQMIFGMLSSYIGDGTYTYKNGRLTLKTDDGKYKYCFDSVGDTFVFDAKASSGMVWYSGMTDGCVFKYGSEFE